MGSIDKACISGFLCRLCSEMHRTVIHIYGDQGQKHGLVEKINGYLPITISPTDPLPKTICEACLRRVEQHYELLLRLAHYRESFSVGKKEIRPRLLRVRSLVSSDQNSTARSTGSSASSSSLGNMATTSTSDSSPITSNSSQNINISIASSSYPAPQPRRVHFDVASSSTSSQSSTSDDDTESLSGSGESVSRPSTHKTKRNHTHRPYHRPSRPGTSTNRKSKN